MKTVLFIILIILSLINVYNAQSSINLTSSLTDKYAYPEQVVYFWCVVANSPILAWSSPNYIGDNGIQLEILAIDQPGTIMTSNIDPNTVATLSNVMSGGETIIRSSLRILVSSQFRASSVACHNVGQGTENITTFQVHDLPAQEVNSSGLTACPGDMLSFTCETRDSPILVWQSDYYIGIGGELLELLSILPVGTKLYKNSNAVAELTNTSYDNGTWIIVSRLNITVLPSIVLQDHSVTCSNVGIGTRQTITFQLADDCYQEWLHTTTSIADKIGNNSDSNLDPLDYLPKLSMADPTAMVYYNILLSFLSSLNLFI